MSKDMKTLFKIFLTVIAAVVALDGSAQNIAANEIAGYNEHTATLWREFKFEKCKFRLQGEIINLTDAQYDIIKYYPMPGRSWRITGTVSF